MCLCFVLIVDISDLQKRMRAKWKKSDSEIFNWRIKLKFEIKVEILRMRSKF